MYAKKDLNSREWTLNMETHPWVLFNEGLIYGSIYGRSRNAISGSFSFITLQEQDLSNPMTMEM